jgi:ATP adenylyltransferase
MIAPYSHHARLQESSPETIIEMAELARHSERIIQNVFRPGGLNIGINLGTAAGAGIRDHYHLHIVPRWPGDTNFMTAIGEVRVLPESLQQTYDRLKLEYDRIAK